MWSIAAVDPWWERYRAEFPDDAETPRIGEHVGVAKQCVQTCCQLQEFHDAVVKSSVYVQLARLPVRLSLGTAQRVQDGLRASYEGFFKRLAEASGIPALPPQTVQSLADAYTHATWRLVSSPNSASELDERARLVGMLRSQAQDRALRAVERIVADLDKNRDLVASVRDELLELERLAPSRSNVARCTPAIRRWFSGFVGKGGLRNAHRLVGCAKSLGSDFPTAFLSALLYLQRTQRDPKSADGKRLTDAGFEYFFRNLMPQLSDANAALARLGDTCERMARSASTSVTLKIAMGSTVHISLSGEAPSTSLDGGGVRALQAPAHLGAFGPDGLGRVYVQNAVQQPSQVRLLCTEEASSAWQLRALADITASGALSLRNVAGSYAHWVIKYEYAKHEGALRRLFYEELLPLGAPAPEIVDAAAEGAG